MGSNMVARWVPVVVVLIAGVAWPSAAQALEGPFYKEGGSRLSAGESAQFSTGIRAGVFALGTSKLTLTCEAGDALRGAQLKGSSGHSPGHVAETLIFTKCAIAGNGTGCLVGTGGNGVIETKPLFATLSYPNNSPAKGDKVLQYLHPEAGTKATFAEIKFSGLGCTHPSLLVEGGVIGEVQNSVQETIRVKEEPAEAMIGGVLFTPTNIAGSWEELSEGLFAEQHPELIFGGEAAQLEYNQVIFLTSKNNWGVYT